MAQTLVSPSNNGTQTAVFQRPQALSGQPTHRRSQPREGGADAVPILYRKSFSLERWIAHSVSTTGHNKCRFNLVPCTEDTWPYTLITNCCVPLKYLPTTREIALGCCLRSLVTLRGPTLELLNLKMTGQIGHPKRLTLGRKAPLISQEEFCP